MYYEFFFKTSPRNIIKKEIKTGIKHENLSINKQNEIL